MKCLVGILIIVSCSFSSSRIYAQNTQTLNVVSWNVFLRPAILNDNQLSRVDSIADYLLNIEADVLVLQEVFHKRAKKKLIQRLGNKYKSCSSGGKKSFWGVPSGVIILSKHKIISENYVSFKEAVGSDKMAKKGGVSVIINFFNAKIQIIGTHLQAGRGEKRKRIRKKQLLRLQTLEDSSATTSLYVGDFNITKNSIAYEEMLARLECENIETSGKNKATANFSDNELYPTSGKAKWIDFILLRKNRAVRIKKSHIEEPKCTINGKIVRLSDHNPIFSSISIPD